MTSCIDISHWQGFPDFTKVRAAGVVACIMKATEGTSFVDPNRAQNYVNATKAGIACCTYHWLKPGNAAAQIAFYLKTIDPAPCERMVIDYEETGCTLADLREAVQALLADPRGLKVTVYSGHLLKQQLLGGGRDEFLAANTDLWLAQYASGRLTWPIATYPQWTLLQYSESGKVDGINRSAVDLNRFNGTDAELLTWISPAAKPKPEPKPRPLVKIVLDVPDGVALAVYVNNENVYSG